MPTIAAYRYEILSASHPGEAEVRYFLQPRAYDPDVYEVREERVEVELLPGVQVAESGGKELRLYREHVPYGRSLEHALQEGWCRIAEPGESRRAAPAA